MDPQEAVAMINRADELRRERDEAMFGGLTELILGHAKIARA